jgi:hypothetical protein
MSSIKPRFAVGRPNPLAQFARCSNGVNCVVIAFKLALTATLVAFSSFSAAGQSTHDGSWAELTLRSAGFPAGADGARQFLESLKPTDTARALTFSLIDQLGQDSYANREAAMAQLGALREIDMATLRQFRSTANPEVRWRAYKVLMNREYKAAALLSAALAILEQSPDITTRELAWNGSTLAYDRTCLANLSRFMAQAYKLDSASVVAKSKVGDNLTRVVAIETIRLLLTPEKAAEVVRPMLQDPDPMVAFGVCRVLADSGERECLRALANLTGVDDSEIATSAVWLLESLTGHSPESKIAGPRGAAEICRYWTDWCDAEGRSATLRFPVGRNYMARGNLAGGMLYSTGSMGQIVLTDRAGERIWVYDNMPAWSAEKLRNGNILIASFDKAEVREVALDNRVVWRWSQAGSRPIRAKPLPTGNVLVADYDGKRVIELGESGQKIWEVPLGEENCFDAERLENGNTLVATPTALIEFRPDHEKVKTWPISGRINSVQVLSTGNFLVANHGESSVMELNRHGDILWKYSEPGASEAFQTDDGHYLITSDRRCIELSPDRMRVRVLHPATYGSARR